jgi:hypothetical protein
MEWRGVLISVAMRVVQVKKDQRKEDTRMERRVVKEVTIGGKNGVKRGKGESISFFFYKGLARKKNDDAKKVWYVVDPGFFLFQW